MVKYVFNPFTEELDAVLAESELSGVYLKLDCSNDPLTGALTIEKTDSEALLVRKDSDGGDVFTVDTTNERVLVGTPSSPTGLLYVNKLDDSTATGTVTNYGLYQYYTGNSQTITGGTFNLLTSYGGSFTNIVNQTYDSASQLGGFTVRGIQVNAQHNGKTIGTAPAFGSSQTLDGINLATTSRFDQGVNVSGTNTTRGISNFVNELTTVRSGGLTSTIDAINTSIALNASLIAPATGLTQTVAGERITINESATNQGSIIDAYGLYITISSARGSSPARFNGIWIDSVTGGTTNRGIVLDQDGAGGDIYFGEDQDAYIRYDGTDLEIQPNAVGSGKIKLDTFTIPNTVAQGDLLYASSTTALSSLAKNTTATRYLSNTGTSNNPAWAQINLANGVTGTLPTANGGTNQTTWTAGRVVFPTSATQLGGDAAFFWDNTVKNLSLNFTAAAQPATSRYTYYGNYVNNVAVSAAGDAVVHSNFYGTSSFGKTYTNTSALLASKYGFYSSVTAADIFTGTTGSSIFSKDITGIFSFIVNSEENRTTSSNAQTNYGIRASLSANQKQTTSVATATFNEYGILSSVTANYTQTTGTINSNIYGISSVVSEAAGSTRSNQNIIGLNVDVSSNRAGSSLKGIVLPRDGAGGDIYMGAGNDFFLSYDGTDGYIQAITGKIKLIPVDGSSVEIGGGGAGIDYSLSFNGETNDGLITWMEDEDYFKYSDGILMDSTEEIFFRDSGLKIFSQADGYLNIVSDTGTRLGDATPTNYTQFDSTGHQTMVGTAQPWEDLRIEPVARTTGTGAPTFEKYFDDVAGTSRGVFLYSFTDESVANNEKEIFFTMQMPHEWNGGDIKMHVHWVPATSEDAVDVLWGLEYTWKDIGEVYGDTTIVNASTTFIPDDANLVAGKHYIATFSALTPGTSADGLSSVLIGRLFRNSSAAGDTYTGKCGLLYIDAHYQKNSLGSTDEYTK